MQHSILSLLATLSFAAPFDITSSPDTFQVYYRAKFFNADRSHPLVPIRLLAFKPIVLLPLHHPTIDHNTRLRLFWLHNAVVCHTPTVLATVVCQSLLAPRVRFCFPFDFDLIWFVVGPEGAVATADGAEALVRGLAEGWEGDADGLAVAGYLQAIRATIASLV